MFAITLKDLLTQGEAKGLAERETPVRSSRGFVISGILEIAVGMNRPKSRKAANYNEASRPG